MNLGSANLHPMHQSTGFGSSVGSRVDVAGASPCAIVARGYSSRPMLLGLDRPLDLKGGDRLEPTGLPMQLRLNWLPEVTSLVAAACRDQSVQGTPWFQMRPTALSGRRGLGRTHICRTVARAAGVPFVKLDVSSASDATWSSYGMEGPDIPMPSRVVLAMASSGCANPLVLVTGVDHAASKMVENVASMIASQSSARWADEALEAVIDLSNISWIVQTEDGDNLPPSFPADLEVVEMAKPDRYGAALLGLSLFNEVIADLQLSRGGLEPVLGFIVDYVRSHSFPSVMELHRIVVDAVVEYDRARR
jgi:hypothetical protein